MTATGIVAIIGAGATPIVAMAGLLYSYYAGRRDRAATLALAKDGHAHELEVRRRERAYEARKGAYTNALNWALRLVQAVQLTDPIITYEGMPGPPDELPPEVFDRMIVEVAAFGSDEVDSAIEDFRDKVPAFYGSQMVVTTMRNQRVRGDQFVEAQVARDDARKAVADAFGALRETIRKDLAAL